MLYELDGIKKQFGERTVLDISSLSLKARKIHALIGANGAGKTTLLNQLAFLDQPTAGKFTFCGKKVKYDRKSLTKFRRQVVLVDQTPILFSGTVWKNVEFGLRVRGIAKAERTIKIKAALERVGMYDFAMSDIHGLSGGEVKRVALARALAVDPDVLLCDEPTANVDQKNQEVILKILQHANSVRNTSVIFSTHYLSQSRRLADHTILLQNGKLSDAVGENTFKAEILESSGKRTVLKLAENCHFNLPEKYHETTEKKIRVRLLPDKIRLFPVKRDDRRGCTAKVRSIAVEGSTVRITVEMGVVLLVLLDNEQYLLNPPLAGQSVRVEVPDEAVIVC